MDLYVLLMHMSVDSSDDFLIAEINDTITNLFQNFEFTIYPGSIYVIWAQYFAWSWPINNLS